MSRNGYPRTIVIRYLDAFTDQGSVAFDDVFHIDGRWSAQTVRQKLIEHVGQKNRARARAGLFPLIAESWEPLGSGDYTGTAHPMPYINRRTYDHRMRTVDGQVGVLLLRTLGTGRSHLGGKIEVFLTDGPNAGKLAGWVTNMRTWPKPSSLSDRTIGRGEWEVLGRLNDGLGTELTGAALAKRAAFDKLVSLLATRTIDS